MKRIWMFLVVLLVSISGQALAYFEDGHLIRAVYQSGGQYEVLTDLGVFGPTAPYAGPPISLTANPFPSAGTGIFSGAAWSTLQVAYYIKTSTALGAAANNVWTSGPVDGQTSGFHKFSGIEGAVNVIAGFYAVPGTAQVTGLQSGLQSYVYKMDAANVSPGFFGGFIPLADGETNLAGLGTGSAYVDSYLYFYASPNSTAAGLQVADIRTYKDGHSAIFVVTAPVATHFTVSAPATATAGTTISFTVTAKDASENTVAGYAGMVHFTSTDSSATLPANTTLTNGTGTFQATLNTAGSKTIIATDTVTASITGTSGTIAVAAPSVATHFIVSAPATAAIGSAISFTVTAKDASENTVAGYTGMVHFTSTDSSATLPANTTLTNGTGTFQATLNTLGSVTITATDTVTASITGTSGTITVVVASAVTHFAVSAPATAAIGSAISFTVTAKDASENTVAGYTGMVHFTSTDSSATLPANTTLTNGTGTFQATLNTLGSVTITATDTVAASITGTSGTIAVAAPSVATHFIVSAPATAAVGSAISFTVTAKDASENTVAGYTGTVYFTSTDSSATLSGNSTLTNGTGTFQATLNTLGSVAITATDTVAASITGTSGTITVVVASAVTHFAVSAPATATVGTPISFTVMALDANEDTVTGYAGMVHFSGRPLFSEEGQADANSNLPADSRLTNGTGTFQATFDAANNYIIEAIDTVSPSIKGTSGTITVAAKPVATHFTVSVPVTGITIQRELKHYPTTAAVGSPISFTVTAMDSRNNIIADYTGTVHFTSTDESAILPVDATLTDGTGTFQATLYTGGRKTITATDTVNASLSGTSAKIIVVRTGLAYFAVSSPVTATVGTPIDFTVTAKDASNNTVADYTGTVHFTSTDESANLPVDSKLTKGTGVFHAILKAAGSKIIKATDTVKSRIAGTSGTITIVAKPVATHFTVSAPATAPVGIPISFTVTAMDAGENTVTGYEGTVHFTSTDGSAFLPADSRLTKGTGEFHATLKTTGSKTITAHDTIETFISGTSGTITIAAKPVATHFTVSAPATAPVGIPISFTVTAMDAGDNTVIGYEGTVHFTSSDGSAYLPADSRLTKGTGEFHATLKTTGSDTITATDTVEKSVSGTSGTIMAAPKP